jgi:hypothetical protein
VARAEVVFHPAATTDHEDAFLWYWRRSRVLAEDFERKIGLLYG